MGLGPTAEGLVPTAFRPMADAMHRFMSWAGEAIHNTIGGEGSLLHPGWFNGGAFGGITVSRAGPALSFALVTQRPTVRHKDWLMVQHEGIEVASVTDLRTGRELPWGFRGCADGCLAVEEVDWSDVAEYGATVLRLTIRPRRRIQLPRGANACPEV